LALHQAINERTAKIMGKPPQPVRSRWRRLAKLTLQLMSGSGSN